MNDNMKYKVHSIHKACSFCLSKNVPVVMEMRTGKAICVKCILDVQIAMQVLVDEKAPVSVRAGGAMLRNVTTGEV